MIDNDRAVAGSVQNVLVELLTGAQEINGVNLSWATTDEKKAGILQSKEATITKHLMKLVG